MRNVFLLLGFILTFSCEQNKFDKHAHRKTHEQSLNNILIGKWMIYSRGYVKKTDDGVPQELLGHCNSCPFIFFQNGDTGFIQSEGLEKLSSFKWTIKANKLIFKNSEAVDDIIHNGTYRIVTGNNKTIELVDSIRKFAYNLD